ELRHRRPRRRAHARLGRHHRQQADHPRRPQPAAPPERHPPGLPRRHHARVRPRRDGSAGGMDLRRAAQAPGRRVPGLAAARGGNPVPCLPRPGTAGAGDGAALSETARRVNAAALVPHSQEGNMTTDYEQIRYEVDGPTLLITMNRPDHLNAFTGVMLEEMIDAYHRADADDSIRSIIVTGAGRGFCAGADLGRGPTTFDRTRQGETKAEQHRDGGGLLTLEIFKLKKPVIA